MNQRELEYPNNRMGLLEITHDISTNENAIGTLDNCTNALLKETTGDLNALKSRETSTAEVFATFYHAVEHAQVVLGPEMESLGRGVPAPEVVIKPKMVMGVAATEVTEISGVGRKQDGSLTPLWSIGEGGSAADAVVQSVEQILESLSDIVTEQRVKGFAKTYHKYHVRAEGCRMKVKEFKKRKHEIENAIELTEQDELIRNKIAKELADRKAASRRDQLNNALNSL